MYPNDIINKIKKDCLEVHKKTSKFYTLVVSKNNANKVVDQLKECRAELHFNYGKEIMIEVVFE